MIIISTINFYTYGHISVQKMRPMQ